MMEVIAVENHPADSRVGLIEDGTVQTLTSRMGTGGGNVPMVLIIRSNEICGIQGNASDAPGERR